MNIILEGFFQRNRKLALVLFEIFWIVIFVLDRIATDTGTEIPQFIYVNF
jgi:hypothetical protein